MAQQLSLENELSEFIAEWMKTVLLARDAFEKKNMDGFHRDTVILTDLKKANYVSRRGYANLQNVASGLLRKSNLAQKVTQDTARKLLLECFNANLEKNNWRKASERAILDQARTRLESLDLPSGDYIFSAQFSHSAKGLKFHVGPVSIVSKARFYRENAGKLRKTWEGSKDSHDFLLRKWVEQMSKFDHVISVRVNNSERKLGWELARETAEFALNIVRTYFGYHNTHRIRLSGDFILEQNRSSVILEQDSVWLSHGTGGVSSFLDDHAIEQFGRDLEPMSPLFASFAGWLASGKHDGSPTVERLRYANSLIAEAYCEPSDYLRLVRLISAFEALAVIRSNDKSHHLAVRCAIVGSWGEAESACQIYDDIRTAYHLRNMVVHGDAPTGVEVRKAFFVLEKHAFNIMVGFLYFYAGIERTCHPRSIRVLAREIRDRIDWYFFYPEFGFD